MFSKALRDELLSTQAALVARLLENEDYKQLQLVNQMLEYCGGKPASIVLPKPDKAEQPHDNHRNTKEELDAMNEAAKMYQAQRGNAPLAIKDLTEVLLKKGHIIKGRYPGTTVGAMVSARKKEWKAFAPGLWVLTDDELSALQKSLLEETAG